MFGSTVTQEPRNFDAILSSLDNLLLNAYIIIFQKDVDNFEIERKTC